MTAPIGINAINGSPVVYGTADVIAPALAGAAPLTITSERANGDTLWVTSIARRMHHPEYGEVLYAYIDMTRLGQAPTFVELNNARQAREFAAALAAEEAGAAMVPSCDNCGDCAKCC